MASSNATGRPSSSHKSERLPPHNASGRNNGAVNANANNASGQQQQQQQQRSKINSRRSVTPTSRIRTPPQDNDPGTFFYWKKD